MNISSVETGDGVKIIISHIQNDETHTTKEANITHLSYTWFPVCFAN